MRGERVVRLAAAGALAIGVTVLEAVIGPRFPRRRAEAVTRAARYQTGRLQGLRYRLAGRQPDPSAHGALLADRIRSASGPLERRLDNPRIHVLVEDHDVLLQGDVVSADQAETLVQAVYRVPGVRRVRSHLHVGLFSGDTRRSQGAGRHPQSTAVAGVLAAAHGGRVVGRLLGWRPTRPGGPAGSARVLPARLADSARYWADGD